MSTTNAPQSEVTGTGVDRAVASVARRFWAYAMHGAGALLSTLAAILVIATVPRQLAGAATMDDYGRTVSLAWDAFFLVMIEIPAAFVGLAIAALGLLVLRGYRRHPVAYVLIGVAAFAFAVCVVGYFVVEAARGEA